MPLPSDQELTKRRIKAERAYRAYEKIEEASIQSYQAYQTEWGAYVRRGKELGYCVSCEHETVACQCIAIGGGQEER